MGQSLPIFVDEVPEYEARGDNILLKWHGLELFVPVHICIAAVHRCQLALDERSKSKASILPFRREFPLAAE